MYYPCSENKGADQLRGYRDADLRLCFRICKLLVFLCGGSNVSFIAISKPIKEIKAHSLKQEPTHEKSEQIGIHPRSR